MLGLIPAGPCGGGLMLGLANPRVGFESGVLWVGVHDPVVVTLLTSFLERAMAVKGFFPRGCGSARMFAHTATFPARTYPRARKFPRGFFPCGCGPSGLVSDAEL